MLGLPGGGCATRTWSITNIQAAPKIPISMPTMPGISGLGMRGFYDIILVGSLRHSYHASYLSISSYCTYPYKISFCFMRFRQSLHRFSYSILVHTVHIGTRRECFLTNIMRAPTILEAWRRFSAAFTSAIITNIIYHLERRGGVCRERTGNTCGIRQIERAGEHSDCDHDCDRNGTVRLVGTQICYAWLGMGLAPRPS